MKSIRSLAAFTVLTVACFASLATLSNAQADKEAGAKADSGKLYTRCNIWYEKTEIASVNFKTGSIIPAGTELKDVKIVERGRVRKVREISFTIAKSGDSFTIPYEARYSPNQSIEQLKETFISNQTFEELTKGMTPKELECIKTGVLKEGLSKKAVLVAYGYPPKHKTPSTDGNEWRYWMNRVRQKVVNFDANGLTTKDRVVESDDL